MDHMEIERLERNMIISLMISVGLVHVTHFNCIRKTVGLFKIWQEGFDIRIFIFCNARHPA